MGHAYPVRSCVRRVALAGLVLLQPLADVHADGDGAARPFKATYGEYLYDDHGRHYQGVDINLRYRVDDTTVWAGYYTDAAFGEQARVGFDTSVTVYEPWSLLLLPSLQAATRSFVGGSIAAQVGAPFFVQGGIGRTNLQPYANLNFDPNDAISVAVGYQGEDGLSLTLSTIRDDRLHTRQQHSHAILKLPLPEHQRLTLDLLRKTGRGDAGHVSAWGISAAYDFPSWFVRAAFDPEQNFSTANVVRLSGGVRF